MHAWTFTGRQQKMKRKEAGIRVAISPIKRGHSHSIKLWSCFVANILRAEDNVCYRIEHDLDAVNLLKSFLNKKTLFVSRLSTVEKKNVQIAHPFPCLLL